MVSKRPPLLGYNHNVRHAGRLFHVQTEDSGPSRPVITTHIFFEGTILSTARTQYQAEEPDATVQKKMQDQHKSMLKRVRDGAFDHMQEVQSKPPTGASGDAHGAVEANVPKELPPDPPTSRMQGGAVKPVAPAAKPAPAATPAASISEERTAEIVRPVEAKPAVTSSPVAPPPSPGPPPAPPPGSLAERLRRGAAKPAPPPPRVTSPDVAKPAPAAVVEFVADSDDDDEPSVTIEAAEPSPGEDALLSSETPLPAARPLGSMRDSLVPEEEATMRMRASQMPQPTAPPPPAPQPAPARAPASAARPQTTRAIPSALPRPRPSAEGVIVSRYPLSPSRRAPVDPMRVTLINARPTVPAPLALSVPALPLTDEGGLDAAVISYLSRDQRR